MDLFFRIFQHLLPRSRAWAIVIEKTLRNFFEGLTGLPSDFKDFIDEIWLDVFPSSTRKLAEWEAQFGVISPPAAEADRRDLLAALWSRGGGQGPDTLQDVLQDAGFDVYVHEPWFFGVDFADIIMCGEPGVECGEPGVECGETEVRKLIRNPNDFIPSTAILLVNKILIRSLEYVLAVSCGEVEAACGEAAAVCGDNTGFLIVPRIYNVPTNPAVWPYFWYIGGVNFGDVVNIPLDRKGEFETLVLSIGPAHVWAGLFINYV